MAVSRALAVSLVLTLLLLADANQMMGVNGPAPSPLPAIDCGAACNGRCRKTKRPNLCKRACGSCCVKCNCVPPGTSGNYEACPCYFNLKVHNDTRKCP